MTETATLTIEQRIEKAREIIAYIENGPTIQRAKLWTKGDKVRVYLATEGVRGSSTGVGSWHSGSFDRWVGIGLDGQLVGPLAGGVEMVIEHVDNKHERHIRNIERVVREANLGEERVAEVRAQLEAEHPVRRHMARIAPPRRGSRMKALDRAHEDRLEALQLEAERRSAAWADPE